MSRPQQHRHLKRKDSIRFLVFLAFSSIHLEQVYNVVDSRYRSQKPFIVTTNLTLEELQNPEDTAHSRIYDRLLEMCCPVFFTGENSL
jgi:DNA replication protein DnaC